MIESLGCTVQALLGTLFTWFLTFLGAATAVLLKGNQRKFLDTSLGFAAGVMLAASYWSLLEPALQLAAADYGQGAFIPVAIGFVLGAMFVYVSDLYMAENMSLVEIVMEDDGVDNEAGQPYLLNNVHVQNEDAVGNFEGDGLRRRRVAESANGHVVEEVVEQRSQRQASYYRRILLLIVAVTVHNIPEGLAVGVAFGGIGSTPGATFESARALALGIGIQNFPEGMAVSVPLKAAGFSTWKAIMYGQLLGVVEPVFGVLGAYLVNLMTPILPYALAFAAGAMVYVVVDEIIPEAQSEGNGRRASWGAILGFVLMMSMDVALGSKPDIQDLQPPV